MVISEENGSRSGQTLQARQTVGQTREGTHVVNRGLNWHRNSSATLTERTVWTARTLQVGSSAG